MSESADSRLSVSYIVESEVFACRVQLKYVHVELLEEISMKINAFSPFSPPRA